ncbi:MAG: hypothetical protein ACP5E4_03460 [Candidatus Aenigmatarchaeota archaeon]
MGDGEYVRELREGAVGNKLPTLIDLDPGNVADESNQMDLPKLRQPKTGGQKSEGGDLHPRMTEEEAAKNILRELEFLHSSGKNLDEIYAILERKGYKYRHIEPVMLEYLSSKKQGFGFPAQKPSPEPERSPEKNLESSPEERLAPKFAFSKKAPEGAGAKTPPQTSQQGSRQRAGRENFVELEHLKNPAPQEEMPRATTPPQADTQKPAPKFQAMQATDEETIREAQGEFAPLFVKVGKYRETIQILDELDTYLRSMEKLFALVGELEKIRVMNISTLEKMYKKSLSATARLSAGLLKPKGMHIEGREEEKVDLARLDDVITELNKELGLLREEVEKLGKMA